MKRLISIAAIALLAAGCSTSQGNNANGKVPAPDVLVQQTSSMAPNAQEVEGGLPVDLRLQITNNATIPITFQRAQLATIGDGAWTLRTSRNFGKVIAPGATEDFSFTVATQTGVSTVGNNGPVQLRVTTVYDSSEGGFNNIIVAPVGGVIR